MNLKPLSIIASLATVIIIGTLAYAFTGPTYTPASGFSSSGSLISQMAGFTFSSSTDSLEAISNRLALIPFTFSGSDVGIGKIPVYDLDVNGQANATQLCIAGDCQSSWPAGGSPGGTGSNIQFNDNGSFGGESNLAWDSTNKTLTIQGKSGQTSNLTEWQSGSGVIGARITSSQEFSNTGGNTGSEQFGNGAITLATNSVVIGFNATTEKGNSVSIGWTSSTNGAGTVAIGASADATSDFAMAIGNGASASANRGIAIGNSSQAGGNSYSMGIGANASATAASSIAIGGETIAGAGNAIVIGRSATATGGNAISIGISSHASTIDSTVIGRDASAAGTAESSVAIGSYSSVSAGNTVAIGSNSNASGLRSTLLGGSSQSSSQYSIGIGFNAKANFNESIAIGAESTTMAANQFVLGSNNREISNAYLGSGVVDAVPTDIQINATGGNGTNINGANLIIASGKGTGNANGGDIIFQTADTGISGTTLQSLTEKVRLSTTGNFGIGTSSPQTTLDVDGAIRTRAMAAPTCGVNTRGTIYYNSTGNGTFYGCTETGWAVLN